MIKLLIKIAIPIIIGILIYNYFFGTVKEKETSVEVYTKVKDLSLSLVDVMRSEKEKFDEGKYDKAMDKLNDVYNAARNHDEDMTVSEKKKLESEKEELKKDIKETSKLDQKKADEKSKSLNDRLYDLVKRTENLLGKE